jgi:hypothetical protein
MAIAYSQVMKHVYLILLLLLAGCSHDAKRENSLDPELTPAATLTVAVDDTAGTATLTWNRYEGHSTFAEYRVLRRVEGLQAVVTVATITAADSTRIVDRTLDLSVPHEYRVAVVSEDGLVAMSAAVEARALAPPTADVLAAEFDAHTATATIAWTPYLGPRFRAYRLLRRTGAVVEALVDISDSTATTHVDSHLVGNTDYTYQVVTVTRDGAELAGRSGGGVLHELVDSWSLDLDSHDTVRLYREDGRVVALVAGHARTRLLVFTPRGDLVSDQLLMSNPFDTGLVKRRFLATVPTGDGQRLLTASGQLDDFSFGVVRFDEQGRRVPRQVLLYEGRLPDADATLDPGFVVLDGGSFSFPDAGAGFADAVVRIGDQDPTSYDFGRFPNLTDGMKHQDWSLRGVTATVLGRWIAPHDIEFLRSPPYPRRQMILPLPSWRRLRFAVDVIYDEFPKVALSVGSHLEGPRLAITQRIGSWQLEWQTVVADSVVDSQVLDTIGGVDFPTISGVPFRLDLAIEDGHVRAEIWTPLHLRIDDAIAHATCAVARLEDRIAMTVDAETYTLTDDLEATPGDALPDWASELRVWQAPDARFSTMAACLPEADQVLWGTVPSVARWQTSLRNPLGPHLRRADGTPSPQGGSLLYPVSMDSAPDGRLYILDAGNARVVALDAEGSFITAWGAGRGSAEDQFDFGDGTTRRNPGLDYRGSIVVDDDGFIYVADVGNRRIQKFAP